jgi:hypothetical protein
MRRAQVRLLCTRAGRRDTALAKALEQIVLDGVEIRSKGETDQQMLFNPWYVFNLWFNLLRATVFGPWAAPLQAAQLAWGAQRRTARDLTRFSERMGKRGEQLAEAQESQPPAEESPHTGKLGTDSQNLHVLTQPVRRHKSRSRIRAAGTAIITRTQKSKHKKGRAVRRAR